MRGNNSDVLSFMPSRMGPNENPKVPNYHFDSVGVLLQAAPGYVARGKRTNEQQSRTVIQAPVLTIPQIPYGWVGQSFNQVLDLGHFEEGGNSK